MPVQWSRLLGRLTDAQSLKRGLCIMSPYPMGRLQLHALAYNLANFLRTLALPAEMESRSLTTLREKVVKIGAKVMATLDTASSRWPRSPCRAISSAASWR